MADLGELGNWEGPPTSFLWTPAGLASSLLPWALVLVVLLALKSNRRPAAWWIWVPLVVITVVLYGLNAALGFLPGELLSVMYQVYSGLAFAMALVALLAPWLSRPSRPATFFGVLFTMILAGLVAGVELSGLNEFAAFLVIGGLVMLNAALAISLAAFCCRHQYTPGRFLIWLSLWLPVFWLALTSPFLVLAVVQGGAPPGEFFLIILAMTAISLAIMIPFLVLAFAQALHRERFCALYRLEEGADQAQPAVVPA